MAEKKCPEDFCTYIKRCDWPSGSAEAKLKKLLSRDDGFPRGAAAWPLIKAHLSYEGFGGDELSAIETAYRGYLKTI